MAGARATSSGALDFVVEARSMVALAFPIVLTNLSQQAMQTTDVLMIGRLGATELAASVMAAAYFFLFFVFTFGVMNAGAGMMAQDLGRKLHSAREVRRTVRQSFWAVLALGIPFLPAMWFAAPVFALLGQDPALIPLAEQYMRSLMWCYLPAMGFMTLRGFTACLERPTPAMIVTLLAIGLNVLANHALIFGNYGFPAMGLTGAGLATTISNLVLFGGLSLVVVWHRRFRRYAVFGRFWRPDWGKFRELFRIGLPAGATWTLEVGFFVGAAFVMGLFGATQLAAHQIALQVPSITFMVPMGIAMAATVRVGLAAGGGDRRGVAVAGWTALALGCGFMSVVALPLLLWPEWLAWLFLDRADPGAAPVIAYASGLVFIAAFFQVVDGAQAIGQGILRGLKDTRVPMLIAVLGYWVIGAGVSFGLAFPGGMAGQGVWLGFIAGLGATAILVVGRFSLRERLGLV